MRNTIIGIVIGIVIGVVVGATVVAPRLKPAESLSAAGEAARMFHMTGVGPHLVTGPLYHGSPYGFASMELNLGASIVIMPRWNAAETLRR